MHHHHYHQRTPFQLMAFFLFDYFSQLFFYHWSSSFLVSSGRTAQEAIPNILVYEKIKNSTYGSGGDGNFLRFRSRSRLLYLLLFLLLPPRAGSKHTQSATLDLETTTTYRLITDTPLSSPRSAAVSVSFPSRSPGESEFRVASSRIIGESNGRLHHLRYEYTKTKKTAQDT